MKPWFFENNKIPVWLSKLAPIEIWALSFGPFVFCRGRLSDTTKTHETIHYHQQLETLFVLQWTLYILFWLYGLLKYRNGKKAYYENPFEREAYANQEDTEYLSKRPFWAWRKYV